MENSKEQKALIVIDIQNDYFEGGAMELVGADQAAVKAGRVINRFRACGLPVFHVQHIALSPTASFFLPHTTGAEIHPLVKPLENEPVIVKHFPNSFRETDLLPQLQAGHFTGLVIVGMMTHMCIDATVRAAWDYGFNCTLVADACATRNLSINGQTVEAAQVQTAFLSALNNTYCTIVNSESI